MPSDQLALTGERTVPGIARENYWFRRHLVVYEALAPRCRGVVLEAGCGEGYGADLLAARRAPGARRSTTTRRRSGTSGAATRGWRRRGPTSSRCPVRDGVRRRGGVVAGRRAPLGPGAVPARVPTGAGPRRRAAALDAEPHHVLPRPRHAAQPVPHARAVGRRAGRAAGRRRVRRRRGARPAPRAAAARARRRPRRIAGRRPDRGGAGRRRGLRRCCATSPPSRRADFVLRPDGPDHPVDASLDLIVRATAR